MTNPKGPKPRPPDDPAQSDRFIATAKQVEAEEGGAQFERAMKAVAPPATWTPLWQAVACHKGASYFYVMRHSGPNHVSLAQRGAVFLVLIAASGTAFANAIIPYMAVPWGQAILFPIVVLAEAPFVRRHAGGGFVRAVWHSLLANLGSTIVGAVIYVAVMALVGESLFRFWSQGHLASGGMLRTVVVATGFAALLWLVSCLVESVVLTLLRKPADAGPIWRACIQANALTYAVLLAIAVALEA